MELSEAKELLETCIREELRDHAFGDVEIVWMNKKKELIAGGYFGGGNADVWFYDTISTDKFTANAARSLRGCGTEGHITRNDETGPDIFVEGNVMPGLTLEGVREELTTPPKEVP